MSLSPICITNQESISSTIYAQIFRRKVCSKPNSKQRKVAQFAFVRKMHTKTKNVDEIDSKRQRFELCLIQYLGYCITFFHLIMFVS